MFSGSQYGHCSTTYSSQVYMKLYCKCCRKDTGNKDKEYDFPIMKVMSMFCAECGSLKFYIEKNMI